MRKLLFLMCTLLCGCTPMTNSIDYEYDDVLDKHIQFGDIFTMENDYFIYIYMIRCYHCNLIKNQMIEYSMKYDNFYFLECPDEISISNDVSHTIGIKTLSELSINGTPTLLMIEDKMLVLNISGSVKILNYLDI